jgi:hypothetical protein
MRTATAGVARVIAQATKFRNARTRRRDTPDKTASRIEGREGKAVWGIQDSLDLFDSLIRIIPPP